MRQLPIGIQDFKAVRDEDYYFVDKSMLIGQMLDQNRKGVFLYTRPRRFGKSLNLSMIDAFFNIKYKDNTWFDGLEISKHPEYDRYRNAFPVISIDMRCDNIRDFDVFLYSMKSKMAEVYDRFAYLLDSSAISEMNKGSFNTIYGKNGNIVDTEHALRDLCRLLEKHHNSKVIVLIDEYDSIVNTASDIDLRHDIISFLKEMMSSLLKGNDSLQMGVVTGIMQITKENIFSGLNNLYVNNILGKRFDEMYGFTDDEVRQICADYGHPEKFSEAKEWYDGYRFGDVDIYNPWSILNYIQEGFEPAPYWVNTSGNSIIDDLLSHADENVLNDLKALGSGGSIAHDVTATLTFADLYNGPDAIYSLMVLSGYLKAVPDGSGYTLSIPNKELYSVFASTITRSAFDRIGNALMDLRGFSEAVLAKDIPAMEKTLYALVADTLSSRVLNDEHSYQAFIAGMLMTLSGKYRIGADFESGKGYYDIRMERRSGTGCNVIMELKRSKSEGQREHDAREALRQIREKDYARGLNGQTVLYGIAFFGKEPLIISEML